MSNLLAMVLAGGRGSRLMPLTCDRAKPAVPFGGRYRLVDFVLSNLVNSGYFKIVVLTQYKSQSLNRHLSRAWRLSRSLDQFVEPVPAQQRTGLDWYKGSVDAVYQNLNMIEDEEPDVVAVFGADHIYKMDIRQMLRFHLDRASQLTIAAVPVPIEEASSFGVIIVDKNWRIVGFEEKPSNPTPLPTRPDYALASMGNYLFSRDTLVKRVEEDADNASSSHDFGKDVIPRMLRLGDPLFAYDFSRNRVPGANPAEHGYWRDVGSIASYFDASMDLVSVTPALDLYNRHWPVRTDYRNFPSAKFVHADGDRVGTATESLVSEGCIISGGRISRSLLAPRVRVNSYSTVDSCVLFDSVNVGRYANLRRVIVDKSVVIPEGCTIGFDPIHDRARGLTVTPEGITVVGKGTEL